MLTQMYKHYTECSVNNIKLTTNHLPISVVIVILVVSYNNYLQTKFSGPTKLEQLKVNVQSMTCVPSIASACKKLRR